MGRGGGGRPQKVTRSGRIGLGLAVFLALYLGFVGRTVVDEPDEVLPFFRWDLFSLVPPSDDQDYSVRLVVVDDQILASPTYYENAQRHLRVSATPDAQFVMRDLGRALEDARVDDAEAARRLLEDRYLGGLEQATYEVVRRRFDPVERLECACFQEEQVLGRYELGEVAG